MRVNEYTFKALVEPFRKYMNPSKKCLKIFRKHETRNGTLNDLQYILVNCSENFFIIYA